MTVEFQVLNLSQDVGKLSGSRNCVALATVALKTGAAQKVTDIYKKVLLQFLW
jgi:hypothetical protein